MNFLSFFKLLAIAIVQIIEQPASDSIRFRYSSDERLSGPVMCANSTEDEPTFPTIFINTFDYNGPVCVITSCVSTKYEPYMPHPNSLLGHNCSRGVRTDCIKKGPYPKLIKFSDLNIERTKMPDVKEKLNDREKLNIDPYLTGFSHKDVKKLFKRHIDTKEVRLCFQVFLAPNGNTVSPVATLVSDPIRSNSRVLPDLNINKISHYTSSVNGGKEIIILCSTVYMRDLQIRFFEKCGNNIVWEKRVRRAKYVHKNCAITLDTPKYKSQDIDVPVNVFIQLQRPSDGCRSDPIPFQYIRDPCNSFPKMKYPKVMQSEVLLKFFKDPSKRIRTNENISSDVEFNSTERFYSTEHQHGYQTQENFNNFLMAQPSCSSNIQLPSCSRNIQLPSSSTHLQQPVCSSNLQLPSCSTLLQLPSCSRNIQLPSSSTYLQQPSCSNDLVQQPSFSINLEQQEQNQENWTFSPLLHSNTQSPLENESEPSGSSKQNIQHDIDIDFDFDEFWKIWVDDYFLFKN